MRTLKIYLAPLLWTGIIIAFSTETFREGTTYGMLRHLFGLIGVVMTYQEMDSINFFFRKTAHFAVYAALAALWLRAFIKSGRGLPAAFLLTFIFSFLCAVFDEFHQAFEPLRTSLLSDVLIDVSGASFALLLYALRIKSRRAARAACPNPKST